MAGFVVTFAFVGAPSGARTKLGLSKFCGRQLRTVPKTDSPRFFFPHLSSCIDNFTNCAQLASAVLNPASPLPLYHQLAELLRSQIVGGELSAGARLPSEPELSRTHGIGRPTVRQATEVLQRAGLVERRRGSGTYVRSAPRRVDLFSLAGTLSSFRRGGLELETKLSERVGRRFVPETDTANPFAGREAYHFSRSGKVEGRPVLFEELWLEPEVFPDLARMPLSGASLSEVVRTRYYLSPSHAEQSFRVARAPKAACTLLEVSPRQPLLQVRRTLHFPHAPSAIFSELYCRTGDEDELVFSQTLSQEPSHG